MAARHQGTLNRPNPLPREVAPGIFWLGECLEQRQQGKIYHGCNASFLIVGETASMLVETGHPKDFPIGRYAEAGVNGGHDVGGNRRRRPRPRTPGARHTPSTTPVR